MKSFQRLVYFILYQLMQAHFRDINARLMCEWEIRYRVRAALSCNGDKRKLNVVCRLCRASTLYQWQGGTLTTSFPLNPRLILYAFNTCNNCWIELLELRPFIEFNLSFKISCERFEDYCDCTVPTWSLRIKQKLKVEF